LLPQIGPNHSLWYERLLCAFGAFSKFSLPSRAFLAALVGVFPSDYSLSFAGLLSKLWAYYPPFGYSSPLVLVAGPLYRSPQDFSSAGRSSPPHFFANSQSTVYALLMPSQIADYFFFHISLIGPSPRFFFPFGPPGATFGLHFSLLPPAFVSFFFGLSFSRALCALR